MNNTGKGALIGGGGGAALGAGLGAIIGGGKGAAIGSAIGAGVGAGAGALIGRKMDKQQQEPPAAACQSGYCRANHRRQRPSGYQSHLRRWYPLPHQRHYSERQRTDRPL